jgi:hypothetical protein
VDDARAQTKERICRESIAGVQFDGVQVLEFDGAGGHLIAMISFPHDGLQYSDHNMESKTPVQQAWIVAKAFGHSFDW